MPEFIREVHDPIYAIRRWYVKPDGLWSITARHRWPGPVIRAEQHGRPINPHTSWLSVFAWNDRGVMVDPILSEEFSSPWAYGIIELRDRVSIHTHGFRAETAILRLVVLPFSERSLLPDIESLYQCEAFTLKESNFLAAYNSQLANRYAEGTLQHDLESIPQWCQHFLWRTKDDDIFPLGSTTDHHLRFIWRIQERWSRRGGVFRRHRPPFRERVIIEEAKRRGISSLNVRSGFASRFTPAKGKSQ